MIFSKHNKPLFVGIPAIGDRKSICIVKNSLYICETHTVLLHIARRLSVVPFKARGQEYVYRMYKSMI